MKIVNETPVIIPPVEEKTFPDLWIYSINIIAPTTTSGRVQIDLLPYSSDRQEIYPGNHQILSTDDLWSAINEVPEVAQAMGAIFLAIDPLKQWLKNRENPIIE